MITVKEIKWLDSDYYEADVLLTDGRNDFICFASPCHLKISDEYKDFIYPDTVEFLHVSDEKFFHQHYEGQDTYQLIAQLLDKENGILKLGDFHFKVSSAILPGDTKEGDFLDMRLYRLDI